MRFIIKILVTALAGVIAAYIIPNVALEGFTTAIILSLVLALLNTFIKPVLVILTLPVTLVPLGLFFLVINIIIIEIADALVDGFAVGGWFYALLFSLIVSLVSSVVNKPAERKGRLISRY